MISQRRWISPSTLLVCLLAAGGAHAQLLSRFTFDGDLLDSGPGGNHGTFVGGATPVFVAGRDAACNAADMAVSLDGVDDYVRLAQTTGLPLNASPALSITLWVKGPRATTATPVNVDRRLFSEGSTTSNNPLYNLGTDNTAAATNAGTFDFFFRNNANTTLVNHRKSSRVMLDDTWHHVAWIDDNGITTAYIDGVKDPNFAPFTFARPALTTNTTTIGAILRAAAGSFFTGAIDDVRLFTSALTEAEVRDVIASPCCPAVGDTTCTALEVTGPPDGGVGTYTLSATGADDSGAATLLYTFSADNGAGTLLTRGPQAAATADFPLTPGTWTLAVRVDDDLICFDTHAGDTCTETAIVFAPPMLVSRWPLDGNVLDSEPAANHGTFVGDVAPTFTDGHDGTPAGAILLDGVDDHVAITQTTGLPIYINKSYTLALWVKGAAQVDRRVFCEGSTADNNPLWGLGTHSTGAGPQADVFVRNDGGAAPVNHRLSGRGAFDDTWHHLAWVDAEGVATLYIDGVRDSGDFRYSRGTLSLNRSTIGAVVRAAVSGFFAGAIDDVRVYNYALTPAEVSALVPESPGCAADGDTHCDGVSVAGPARGGPGTYTATATARDDTGEPVLYTFTLTGAGGGFLQQVGPQSEPTASFSLNQGDYRVSVAVDDFLLCKDVGPDSTCTADVSVGPAPRLLISHWTFDGDLLDPESGNDGTFVGKDPPPFRPGFDCTPDGALQFDGAADYVQAAHNLDLPISRNEAFSVAMWVKGPPQVDRRVFSESSTTNRNTLFNIGTDNTGATGTVDIFIRDDANVAQVNHLHSTGIAFDDTWHHIAYTDQNGTAMLYIDGVLDATNFNYTRGTLTRTTTTIGGILRDNTCCWFNGRIDDVRLYNYALDAGEVAGIFGDGPGDCCPETGDTHCQGVTVSGPAAGGPGDYVVEATASDDSGQDIAYTFTASNQVDPPMVIGPQAASTATFTLGGAPGSTVTWTFTVVVDDDALCADQAPDSTCSTQATVSVCPDAGDTHCQGITIAGPGDGAPGSYLVEATASDDSGDAISYTFTASNGVDPAITVGPQPESSTAFELGAGSWIVSVAVDDGALCGDVAPDASCQSALEVAEPGVGPFVKADANADGRVDLSDAVAILAWLFLGGAEPPCLAAANPSNEATISLTAAVYILNYLFLGGPPPRAPFPECGRSTEEVDRTLGCASFPPCS